MRVTLAGRDGRGQLPGMTLDARSTFAAGHEAGVHLAASVARTAATQLLEGARWWNRSRRRLMARALMTYAGEIVGSTTCGSSRST